MEKRKLKPDMNGVNSHSLFFSADGESDEDEELQVPKPKRSSFTGANVSQAAPRPVMNNVSPPRRIDMLTNLSPALENKVAALNTEFLSAITQSVAKSPNGLLLPLLKDYMEHAQRLLIQNHSSPISSSNNTNAPITFESLGMFFHQIDAALKSPLTIERSRQPTIPVPVTTPVTNTTPAASFKGFNFSSTAAPSGTTIIPFNFTPTPLVAKNADSSAAEHSSNKPTVTPSNTLINSPPKVPSLEDPLSVGAKQSVFSPGFFSLPSAPLTASFNTSATSNTAPAAAAQAKDSDDESEEPPQNVFKAVLEDDSLYSIRCKVFVIADGKCQDRGVGTLFVKQAVERKPNQVVVRADNNLGTVLLNMLLQKEIPLTKKNAKDVMLMVPEAGKSIPYVIRLKTESEADQVLNRLRSYQDTLQK